MDSFSVKKGVRVEKGEEGGSNFFLFRLRLLRWAAISHARSYRFVRSYSKQQKFGRKERNSFDSGTVVLRR